MGGKKDISRRGFLALGAASAAAGAATAGHPATAEAAAGPPREGLPRVPRARLGETGARIPILGSGGGFELTPRFDPRVAECVRFGVDYFDLGHADDEAALGRFLAQAGHRDELWITSRSDRSDPEGFETGLNESLRRLGTATVDLFCLEVRRPAQIDPALAEVVGRLKKQGKLRHFGLRCSDEAAPDLLSAAPTLPWVEVVTFRHGPRSGRDDALHAALDRAARAGVGLIAEAPTPEALGAIWADERITAAVCALPTFEQIKASVAAARRRPPASPGRT